MINVLFLFGIHLLSMPFQRINLNMWFNHLEFKQVGCVKHDCRHWVCRAWKWWGKITFVCLSWAGCESIACSPIKPLDSWVWSLELTNTVTMSERRKARQGFPYPWPHCRMSGKAISVSTWVPNTGVTGQPEKASILPDFKIAPIKLSYRAETRYCLINEADYCCASNYKPMFISDA